MPKLTTIARRGEAAQPDPPAEFPRTRFTITVEFPPGWTSGLARLCHRRGLLSFIKRWFNCRIVEVKHERVVDPSEWESTGR